MRRIAVGLMSTVSALVLLFSYHTSLGSSTPVASDPATSDDPAGTGSGSSAGSSSSSDGTTSSGSSAASGTYTGDTAGTRWGDVQVQITVAGGKITKSEAVVYPTANPRDQEINSYAVPQLNSEVVQQQSGDIDAVSGATVTSDGYIQSVQSAIDQANL